MPISPAAFSNKSGRPMSPTNTKSPVNNMTGASVAGVSVNRKLILSGVWPGVCKTLNIRFPIFISSWFFKPM
ncbi:hypothetical protein D3C86_1818170 [compost metagenome]